ncbi:MAG: outer membrane beta-barrel protein [Bacteroidales bacterium]
MRRFITIVLCFFVTFPALAQRQNEGRNSIRMILIDSIDNQPVNNAVVKVFVNGNTESPYYGISDSKGYVEITRLNKGKYAIIVEHMGYSPLLIDILDGQNRNIDLGKVILKQKIIAINEAVVEAEGSIVQKGDTTEYNAKFFNPAPNDYLKDLLRKMPGLELSGGDVYFKGERVQFLTVENRPFFASDKTIALDNLPAYAVKKVSVFKRKKQFLDGVEDNINAPIQLNIILKDDMKVGWIGNVTPGYGNKDRYLVKGFVGRFDKKATTAVIGSANNTSRDAGPGTTYNMGMPQSPQSPGEYDGEIETILAGVDYAKSSTESMNSFYANSTYRYSNTLLEKSIKRETTLPEGFSTYISDNLSNTRSDAFTSTFSQIHYTQRGADKANLSIRFNPVISYNSAKSLSRMTSASYMSDNEQNHTSSESSNNGENRNLMINAPLTIERLKRGKTKFRFTKATFSFNNNSTNSDNFIKSSTILSNNEVLNYDQKRHVNNNRMNINTGLHFAFSVKDLSLYYNFSYLTSTSDIQTFNYDSNLGKYVNQDEGSSGNIENQIIDNSITLEYRLHLKKKRSEYLLISAELKPTLNRVDTKQFSDQYLKWDIIPTICYSHVNFQAIYSARSNYPSLMQLHQIVNNNNPLYIRTGNPNLLSEYIHTLSVGKRGGVGYYDIQLSLTQNKIIEKNTIDELGITYTVPVNKGPTFNANSRFSLMQVKLSRRIGFSGNLGAAYNRGFGYINNEEYTSNSITPNGSLVLRYKSTFFETELRANARYSNSWFSVNRVKDRSTWINILAANIKWAVPYGFNLISDYSHYFYSGFSYNNDPAIIWNAEICKSILNNRVILSVKGYDLLDQTKNKKIIYADSFVQEESYNIIGRYIMFSLSTKFGKFGK